MGRWTAIGTEAGRCVCGATFTFRGFQCRILGPNPDGVRRWRIVKARATTCGRTGFWGSKGQGPNKIALALRTELRCVSTAVEDT